MDSEEAGPSTSSSSLGQELNIRNSPQENYLDRLNAGLNVETDVFDSNELLDFIISNHQTAADAEDAEQQGAASLPLHPPRPSSPSSHLFRDLDDNLLLEQSLVADLFDLRELKSYSPSENDQSEEMEWSLAEEEAHLDFYKTFNEAANEVMRTVPLREVEGRLSPEQHQVPEVGATAKEGTASSSTSAASTVPEITLEDVIDDWLETDSGVFDFLGSSATTPSSIDGTRRNTFDIDSIPSLGSVESDLELDGGDQATSQSQSEEDEDVDMIQAAPTIHGGRPTPHPHPAQPRGFQVHARMPGLLRGGSSMDQRWQDVVTFLNLQQGNGGHPHGDGSGGPLPLSHTFGSHLHHHGAPLHHHHHHHFSAPPPSAPYNADSARSVLLQNATLPPPDVSSPYSMGPPPNIGSAVASSMHLTNSSDPMIDPSLHYKMIEQSHDMIYYPNTTNNAEMNNQSTTDGLFSTVEDDLQLQFVDMSALNEGIHQMRMLDYGVGASISNSLEGAASLPHGPQQQNLPNGCSSIGMTAAEDRLEASSDSAVSSMGSERVPPMTDPSDSEWVDPDSHPHSSHDSSPYSLDYPGTKGRGYEYYGKDRVPVAQKKHHMFGKRFQQEQGPYVLPPHHNSLPLPYPSASGLHSSPSLDSMDLKYGCGVEFARHQNDLRTNGGLGLDSVHNNHTYALPPNHGNSPLTTFKAPKPPMKDKQPKKDSLSRDDKRARAMNLPITTEDIINLPMDEFNERLSKFDLSEPQLSLIRDIRRRGKNKVAAQNCRKRKLDQIMQLADEVQTIRERKQSLLREQQELGARRHDLKERYQLLYRHVFQALRDPDGNPYSIYEYNLAQAADGSIMMERQRPVHPSNGDNNNPSRRDKSKDDYNNKKAE
ncbi:segmentation protein cap'n'collar isoform X2 [Folsomia candida]|uniref:segmentation protein cap'n'collar isoform X2 n=1 Tax=Folsomia candida TaxID=158441 RepID=UPI0016051077|nr:segmentation protein cap'n'collar isoform X2 [Folsomia candida]